MPSITLLEEHLSLFKIPVEQNIAPSDTLNSGYIF